MSGIMISSKIKGKRALPVFGDQELASDALKGLKKDLQVRRIIVYQQYGLGI